MEIYRAEGTGRIKEVTVKKVDSNFNLNDVDLDENYLPVRDVEDNDALLIYAKRVLRYVVTAKESCYIVGYTDDDLIVEFDCSKSVSTDEDLNLVVKALHTCVNYVNDLCPKCGSKLLRLSTGPVCMRCNYSET